MTIICKLIDFLNTHKSTKSKKNFWKNSLTKVIKHKSIITDKDIKYSFQRESISRSVQKVLLNEC